MTQTRTNIYHDSRARVLRCKLWKHRDGKSTYQGAYHPDHLGRAIVCTAPRDGDRFEIQIISLDGALGK